MLPWQLQLSLSVAGRVAGRRMRTALSAHALRLHQRRGARRGRAP